MSLKQVLEMGLTISSLFQKFFGKKPVRILMGEYFVEIPTAGLRGLTEIGQTGPLQKSTSLLLQIKLLLFAVEKVWLVCMPKVVKHQAICYQN